MAKTKGRAARRRRQKRNRLIALILSAVIVLTGSGFLIGHLLSADADEIRPSDIKDDGQIRVWLKSLGAPQALGLTLRGAYTLEGNAGFRFEDDTAVTLSTDGQTIYLGVGGLYADMGSSLKLTRAASDAPEKGVYIHESERDTLYAGDLYVTVEKSSLQAVVQVDIEDYLYGVVAYEMSDSFPVEALKAQAVAARTYVMRAKQNKPNGLYHVTDTTSDQVYKGFDARLTNVIGAVDATRGVVGTYKGQLAGCYYTASNGGMIATPQEIWGGSGDNGYIERKADPYDLENPSAVVKRVKLPGACGPESPAYAMLMEPLSEILSLKGCCPDYDKISIDEITSIVWQDPVDDTDTGRYNTAVFTLKVSACTQTEIPQEIGVYTDGKTADAAAAAPEEPDGFVPADDDGFVPVSDDDGFVPAEPEPVYEIGELLPLEETVTISVDVYGTLKQALGLSINGGNYELFTMTESSEGYVIEARRYGHGVGMSQRGAQQMASSYGKTYTEILKFYYPGMELRRIGWDTQELPTIEELPSSAFAARAKPTPKLTPKPLPACEEGEYYAKVSLISAGSTLNVREAPSTSGRALGTLDHGDRVIVTGEAEDGWVSIRTAELTGYVKGDYLITE